MGFAHDKNVYMWVYLITIVYVFLVIFGQDLQYCFMMIVNVLCYICCCLSMMYSSRWFIYVLVWLCINLSYF